MAEESKEVQPEEQQIDQEQPEDAASEGEEVVEESGEDDALAEALKEVTSEQTSKVDGSLKRILEIKLPISAVIARRQLFLRDILDLGHGSIIEFDKLYTSDITLEVNDEVVAHGEAVVIREKYGIRVKYMGTLQETIEKIGGF